MALCLVCTALCLWAWEGCITAGNQPLPPPPQRLWPLVEKDGTADAECKRVCAPGPPQRHTRRGCSQCFCSAQIRQFRLQIPSVGPAVGRGVRGTGTTPQSHCALEADCVGTTEFLEASGQALVTQGWAVGPACPVCGICPHSGFVMQGSTGLDAEGQWTTTGCCAAAVQWLGGDVVLLYSSGLGGDAASCNVLDCRRSAGVGGGGWGACGVVVVR